MKHKATYIS